MRRVRQQIFLPDDAPRGSGVRVALLDTGIDVTHPDLCDRYSTELSRSLTTKPDLLDRNGHGTHLAGIIAGSGRASNGVLRGIAPECELVVLKIAEATSGPEWNAAKALEVAIEAKVDIVNYSHGFNPLGKAGDPPWIWATARNTLEEMFELASRHGILCVVAAGNTGAAEGSVTRPGGLECVLTVGGVTPEGAVHPRSGRGPYRRTSELRAGAVERYDGQSYAPTATIRKPDLVAPCEITAPRRGALLLQEETDPELADPFYVSIWGTSQATAVVSGLAAIALEEARKRSIDLGPNVGSTLRKLFMRSAQPLAGARSIDAGTGMITWPNLVATLEDFAHDELTRRLILNDDPIRLVD